MRFLAIGVAPDALALGLSAYAREERIRALAPPCVRWRPAINTRGLNEYLFESYNDGNGGVTGESGTAYFSRPGRMRWDYESPEKKLFLVDGKNVLSTSRRTTPRAAQNCSQSSDWRTPIAILAGKANVSEFCRDIQSVGAGQEGSADVLPLPTTLCCAAYRVKALRTPRFARCFSR